MERWAARGLAPNCGAELLAYLDLLRRSGHTNQRELEKVIAQRDRALAVAKRTQLILQAGYDANRVAFSPSKILDVFQAALMSLDALFATRPDGPQGEGGAE